MTGTHSEEQDQQPRQPIHINPIAVIAGALASVSAAVVASYFGVAGTLIGPAVVSVISSVAAAVYAGLLGHTRKLVQRGTVSVRRVPPELATRGQGPDSGNGPRGQERGGREAAAPAPRRLPGPLTALADQRRRWLVVGGMAVLIFALAIGAVTAVEAAIKEPIASALGVRDRGQARTSVGVAVSRAGGPEPTSSAPSSSAGRQGPSSTTGQPGQAPTTTEPGPSTTGGTQPPPTAPPTTAPSQQPSTPSTPPSTSGGTSATAP